MDIKLYWSQYSPLEALLVTDHINAELLTKDLLMQLSHQLYAPNSP